MSEIDLGVGSRVNHPAYGDGVIIGITNTAYQVCFIKYGVKPLGRDYTSWEVIEAVSQNQELTFNNLEKSLVKILSSWSDISPITDLGSKWEGGTMILKPYDDSLKAKEVPIETFFHKIVMVRDRLRVMEQRINASGLSDEEKINLQQYITRIYGSLTTFNVLFDGKENGFVGEKSKS
ncbi:MAG: hypothetical protein AAFR14_07475 [Bacteroidota bacterium]